MTKNPTKGVAIRLPLMSGYATSQTLENNISDGPTTTSSRETNGEKSQSPHHAPFYHTPSSSADHYDESKMTMKVTDKKGHKG